MIAVTCVPVNAYAMDGESFEDSEIVSEEIQEDTNEEVNEEVNVETYNEDIEELWKRVNAATKATLKHQYDANMLSREQYLKVRDMFQFYHSFTLRYSTARFEK